MLYLIDHEFLLKASLEEIFSGLIDPGHLDHITLAESTFMYLYDALCQLNSNISISEDKRGRIFVSALQSC